MKLSRLGVGGGRGGLDTESTTIRPRKEKEGLDTVFTTIRLRKKRKD